MDTSVDVSSALLRHLRPVSMELVNSFSLTRKTLIFFRIKFLSHDIRSSKANALYTHEFLLSVRPIEDVIVSLQLDDCSREIPRRAGRRGSRRWRRRWREKGMRIRKHGVLRCISSVEQRVANFPLEETTQLGTTRIIDFIAFSASLSMFVLFNAEII